MFTSQRWPLNSQFMLCSFVVITTSKSTVNLWETGTPTQNLLVWTCKVVFITSFITICKIADKNVRLINIYCMSFTWSDSHVLKWHVICNNNVVLTFNIRIPQTGNIRYFQMQSSPSQYYFNFKFTSQLLCNKSICR